MSLRRVHLLCALLLAGGILVTPSRVFALPEKEIRTLVKAAESYELRGDWEAARTIYESLLKQYDPGLNIRERYYHSVRRTWQVRRHQDISYRKEVLSVDYGQSLRLLGIINNTLLDGSFDKKKVDPSKLFRKGLEELDAALGDRVFLEGHIHPSKYTVEVPAFRVFLRKVLADARGGMSRKDAIKKIGEIALAAEVQLDLDPTVAVMEFACGGCYAIDEYTVYLTPNQLRELAQSLSQNEALSVGLYLRIHDNKIIVRDVAMDGPAVGKVFINDEILSIDKQAVANITLEAAKKLLEGPLGTFVEIEVFTPGDEQTRTFMLARQAPATSVTFDRLRDSFYYLKISSFTDATVPQVEAALKQNGMKGLVLDLRENGGGIVDSAIETARKFLTTGVITSSVNQDTKQSQVYHAKNPNALSIPLIVLVDNDTASAAEILAGALKDNGRATLIGQTTFGKGCTQCVLKLPNASGGVPTGGMRLTVARFFSPKGIPYSGRGVVPHIFIDERMAASQSMPDAYIARALDELSRMSAPK